ncbi:MATE family efflux transporter [Thalassotalea psychrophila]|uniref:MATE family efflux transporter n=1 Tax=Thalassotalea psychrophila TaxID=3065647 RepID=A0ABY9TR54_9GAMM|nr:MATE family efflux transporter [Colwelliaceae bacterium SQ149]
MTKSITEPSSNKGHASAKRVAKNTGFLYARMAITVFISLYVTRLVLGSLGTEDFGIYSLVAGMVAMLVFLNAAMAAASQRFMSYAQGEGNTDKQKNIFNVSILLHALIAIAVVILLEVVGYFLFENVLDIPQNRMQAAKYVFQFMVISTFFTIISVPYDAVINAHENMLFVAITGVLEAFLKLGVAIYITYTDFDKLISFGLLMAISAILMLLIKRVYCHKNYCEVDINIKKYFDKPLFIEMGGFASWSFLGSSTSMLSFYGQGIILNMFFGPVVNAAQAIAAQVSGQLGAFSSTMLKALNPLIVKSEGGGNRTLMLNASLLGSKVSFFLLMIFYIPVIIEMPYIFSLWLKEVPEHAIVFCRLLLIKHLMQQPFLTLDSSIAAVGNIKRFQIYTSFLNIFPLVVGYLLFKNAFPAYSLYVVFIFHTMIWASIILFFSKKYCSLSISYFFKDVIFRCLMSFIMTFSMVLAFSAHILNDNLRLFVVLFLNCVVFVFVTWFVGFNTKDRDINKLIVKKMITKFQ